MQQCQISVQQQQDGESGVSSSVRKCRMKALFWRTKTASDRKNYYPNLAKFQNICIFSNSKRWGKYNVSLYTNCYHSYMRGVS